MSNENPNTSLAEGFRDALRELEESSSTDALIELYADDCTLGNVVDGENFSGADGVREFWSTYRDQFGDVRSEFAVVAGDDTGAVLEWTTTGTINGSDVRYRGATVLEISNGMIVRSMAYFDPAGPGGQVVDSASTRTDTDTGSESESESADAGTQGWSGPAPADEQPPEATQ